MTTYTEYLDLVAKATLAAAAYYDTEIELISDEDYDNLIEQIENLSNENGWDDADALLDQVAAGASSGGDVEHVIPMLSLAKASSTEALKAFVDSVSGEIILEPKLDGIAISAIYKNGSLVRVATRGDGHTGENITDRTLNVKGLPATISHKGELEVRGEVFITSVDFVAACRNRLAFKYGEWAARNPKSPKATLDSLYKVAISNRSKPKEARDSVQADKKLTKDGKVKANANFYPDEAIFANPRNAVAGALRNEQVDYEVSATFAAYDVFSDTFTNGTDYRTRILFASSFGFKTANGLIPKNLQVVTDPLAAVVEFGELRKNKLDYPTDGVVLKANSISERDRLGSSSRSPKWAAAYKYPSIPSQTEVIGIEMTIGRTGRLALRAKFNPVLVDGTLIEYASLHNVGWTQERDIRIGDTVLVRRANDVIPYIDGFVSALRPATAQRWMAPLVCPQCEGIWDKSTLLWRCTSPTCAELNGVIFAAGREYFDWEGLSEKILTRLNDAGKVRNVADVFDLTLDDLCNLYMGKNKVGDKLLGKTVGTKLFKEIQKSKTRPLSAVLPALGIRTLGRTFGRRLAAHFGSMAAIVNASVEKLTEVEGIATKKAVLIHAGLRQKHDVIVRLAKAGVTMTAPKPVVGAPVQGKGEMFFGKNVAVSGSIPGYKSRPEVEGLLREIGATPSSSINSKSHFLVADESMSASSKYVSAVKLNVPILTPEKFLELIGK